MVGNERYVDFNETPLPFLRCLFVRLPVPGVEITKARILVAKKSSKAIVGRDWLIALRHKIEQPMVNSELQVNNITPEFS